MFWEMSPRFSLKRKYSFQPQGALFSERNSKMSWIPDKGKMAEHFFMDKMAVSIGEPCVLGGASPSNMRGYSVGLRRYRGNFYSAGPSSQKRNCISSVEGHGNEEIFLFFFKLLLTEDPHMKQRKSHFLDLNTRRY